MKTDTQLNSDIDSVKNEMSHLADTIARQGTAKAEAIGVRVGEALASAQEQITAIQQDVRAKARKAAEVTDQYVHESPWQAIGIGAAVGLLVGFLVARR